MIKQLTLTILCFGSVWLSHAQTNRGQNITLASGLQKRPTYAIIVGVSDYQRDSIYPDLRYADEDARAFYRFLRSPEGGSVPDERIDTLINKGATAARFYEALGNMRETMGPEDQLFVYFAGHGDAMSPELVFLLPHDAPAGKGKKEKNHYILGQYALINVHTVKSILREMIVSRSIRRAILITDACRTNELPGGSEGRQFAYNAIFDRDMGQMQFMSCSPNQASLESDVWGSGRGLFSYHFINGLYGLADGNRDGKITLDEAFEYVSDSVKVYSGNRQKPRYCCEDFGDTILFMAPRGGYRNQSPDQNKAGTRKPEMLAGRGLDLASRMRQAGLGQFWTLYAQRVEEGMLESAYEQMNLIAKEPGCSEDLRKLLRIHLSARLLESVNKVVGIYLTAAVNNNTYTHQFFEKPLRELRLYRQLADPAYYDRRAIQVLLYFFEAHSRWKSLNGSVIRRSIALLDSAIAISPDAAYLYNIKGLLQSRIYLYKESAKTLRKGMELAPGWIYPAHNLAITLVARGLLDSAEKIQRHVIALDTNYQTSYNGMAHIKNMKGQPDSAVWYCYRGLEKDPKDPWLWKQLGYLYQQSGEYDKSLEALHSSRVNDTSDYEVYNLLIKAHIALGTKDSVSFYIQKMLGAGSEDERGQAYLALGNTLMEHEFDSLALMYFAYATYVDSLLSDAWFQRGMAYKKRGEYYNSLICLNRASGLEPELARGPNQMAIIYYENGYFEKAIEYTLVALNREPENVVLKSNLGLCYLKNEEFALAEKYLDLSVKEGNQSAYTMFQLARAQAYQGKKNEALVSLERSLSLNYEVDRDVLLEDKAFRSLKGNRQFKRLVKGLKN